SARLFSKHLYFFFSSRRRHTRFSRDWSSDVCSSDLPEQGQRRRADPLPRLRRGRRSDGGPRCGGRAGQGTAQRPRRRRAARPLRSEERRVGKECRSRWSPEQRKKGKVEDEESGGVRV